MSHVFRCRSTRCPGHVSVTHVCASSDEGGAGAFLCDRIHPPCPTHARPSHRCDAGTDPRPFGCGRVAPECPGHEARGEVCAAGRWECARITPSCEGHRRPGLVCDEAVVPGCSPHAPLVVGVNLPWTHVFCGYDFGIPPKGWRAARPSPRDFEEDLGSVLRELHGAGVRAVRVFLLADAVSYPETRPYSDYAEHGLMPGAKGEKLERARPDMPAPAELSDAYVRDVRAFFDLCAAIGLSVLPSFLSFEAFFPPHLVGDGTVKQGRSAIALGADRSASPEHVDAFFRATLDRLLAIDDGQGRPHPAVLAWEVMNEPDWCVRKRHVSPSAMSRFLANGVERIVAAGYVASIGFLRAEVEWLDDEVHDRFVRLARGRKYLQQLHYYPRGSGDRLPVTNATAFGSATIVGEMAANDTTRARWPDPEVAETEADPSRFLAGRLAYVVESGYRYAFLWSCHANDDKSGLDAESVRQLAAFDAATIRPRDDLV